MITTDLYGLEDGSIPATFEVFAISPTYVSISFLTTITPDCAHDRLEPRRLPAQAMQTRLGQQVNEGLVVDLWSGIMVDKCVFVYNQCALSTYHCD